MSKTTKTKVVKCVGCGKFMKWRADRKPRSADGQIRCQPCSYAYRGGNLQGRINPRSGRTKKCVICGKEFYVPPSRLGQKTCSVACRSKNVSEGDIIPMMRAATSNKGSSNGRYKHGKRVGVNKGAGDKPRVRREVIARDGDGCLMCRKPGPGLHLHRVVYGSHGGRYEVGNCVQLCLEHHALVHSSKRTWAPLLLAHLGGSEVFDGLGRPGAGWGDLTPVAPYGPRPQADER